MASRTYVGNCDVGRGVFAARPIRQGERILTFRGEPVAAGAPIHYTPEGANLLQVDTLHYIYPRTRALYVNHSCNPNAGIRGNVTLLALRDIAIDEEIRFDYSTTMDENLWTMECRCGQPQCRGVVRDFRHLPARVRARYLALGAVSDFIANREAEAIPYRRRGPARVRAARTPVSYPRS